MRRKSLYFCSMARCILSVATFPFMLSNLRMADRIASLVSITEYVIPIAGEKKKKRREKKAKDAAAAARGIFPVFLFFCVAWIREGVWAGQSAHPVVVCVSVRLARSTCIAWRSILKWRRGIRPCPSIFGTSACNHHKRCL